MEGKEKMEYNNFISSWRLYCLIMKMNLRTVGNWVGNILFKRNYR